MELPTSFCPVPWLNLSIDANGAVRPCCKYEQPANPLRAMTNLQSSTLEAAWNSDGMVQLRADFQKGVRPPECQACWSEEAAGVRSLRQEFSRHRIRSSDTDFSSLRPEAPKTLDLKLSNLCNLKCRICAPSTSSLFLAELLEHEQGPVVDYLTSNRAYFQSRKITEPAANLETFRRWLPHLEHVEMFGGEPFIGREVQDLERMMIDAGVAGNISLLYNTNISVFRDEMVERWAKFRKVSISLSLDDLSERLHYERYPSDWEKVQANIAKFRAIRLPQVVVTLVCTVSNYNVWYLPEYVDWILSHCPDQVFLFNFVHSDPEFCITNLPPPVKERITRKIEQAQIRLQSLNSPYACVAAERLGEIPAFMRGAAPITVHWRRFLMRTLQFDQRRNQKFSDVFPEFYQILRPHFRYTAEESLPSSVSEVDTVDSLILTNVALEQEKLDKERHFELKRAEMEKAIQDQHERIDSLILTGVGLEQERDDLKSKSRELEATIGKLVAESTELEGLRAGLYARCEGLEAKKAEADHHYLELQEKYRVLEAHSSELKRSLESTKRELELCQSLGMRLLQQKGARSDAGKNAVDP